MFHWIGRLASLCTAGLLASALAAAEPERPVADGVPAKVLRYAQRVLKTYDADGDGRLQPAEWQKLPAGVRRADANGDGAITPDELAACIARYGKQHSLRTIVPLGLPVETAPVFAPAAEQPSKGAGESTTGVKTVEGEKAPRRAAPAGAIFHVPASRLPPGLPDWFRQRDLDGDGQLTLSEFAPNPTPARIDEFNRFDANRDGIVTAKEYTQVVSPKKPAEPSSKKAKSKEAP